MCETVIRRRTTLYFMATLCSFACTILLGIAMGTTSWVRAYLNRDVTEFNTSKPLTGFQGSNPIDNRDPGAFMGISFFGLFYGCKRFNYGFGGREYDCYSVLSEHEDVYNTNMVIAVVAFLIPAAVFALVSTVFSLVNMLTVPIETLHGPIGLYIWNLIGVLCSSLALVLYLVLYFNEIQHEVLSDADRAPPENFHTARVDFGFSFWLVVSTFVIFCVNVVFVFLAQLVENPHMFDRKKRRAMNANGKTDNLGSGIMY